jgi:hypothetical protein
MIGMTLTFKKEIQAGTDGMGNAVYDKQNIDVENCLIAPFEPTNVREPQAMTQTRGQVQIHLPKTFTGDVSGSTVDWDGETYRLDNDGAKFMNENTPGAWNRYFRAEVIRG